MSLPSTFTVYNASAGSGKTFTLVKEYLKILLSSEDIFKFQQILAVTFTNKAAQEMKERVLKNLKEFGKGEKNDLFSLIIEELKVDAETIKTRSSKILDAILQNYTAFSITTIDSFIHKIIKSFAYDLGLSQSFEVELDAEELLKESIDVLISKIGRDKEISRTLIQYAKDKSENDQSWDITYDLLEFSRMLLNEDHVRSLSKISDKNLEDFESLNEKLKLQNKQIEKELEELGANCLEKISSNGLDYSDFTRSYFPKLLDKLIAFKNSSDKKLSFSATLNSMFLGDKELYNKSLEDFKKQLIDTSFQYFQEVYKKAKSYYSKYRFNRLLLKSIIPLATLKYINQELSLIKEENNIQLNSEFNHLISKNIQNQPAPFIYERIGNKFSHYFIDEMQDTSQMQWQNLVPLLHNTLSQEFSSLLLVGDGKQAIYRWRGGKPEQFIDLGDIESDQHPFPISKNVETLSTNFRSHFQVVDFNNQFFDFASKYLTKEDYKKLFTTTAKQEILDAKKGGYVSIDFVDNNKEDDENSLRYAKQVLRIVESVKEDYEFGEICVITRKRKEGVLIANYLTEFGVPIISSETLLLSNSLEVIFLLNLLEFTSNKSNDVKFKLLDFLYEHLKIKESKHAFFKAGFQEDSIWKLLSIDFDENRYAELPLYEKMEYAIESLSLMKSSNAYIQFFLDEVLRMQQREFGTQDVLDYWELKKDKLSIVSPETSNAVQIMTIHKSKGLEFPIVIYSGDVYSYEQIHPKVWLNNKFEGFDDFLLPFNNELSELNEMTTRVYQQRREELELDSLNLLYVALTRAKEQLFIITDNSKSTNKEASYFSQYFKEFLKSKDLYIDSQSSYDFGNKNRASESSIEHTTNHSFQESIISVPREVHKIDLLPSSSKLWGTTQKEAINYGNLIHEILSKIRMAKDVNPVLKKEYESGAISILLLRELETRISNVIKHPALIRYYKEGARVFNERVLTDIDGQLLIPDRLVFLKDEVIILDYKTGLRSNSHKQQLFKYERLIKTMGYQNIKKVLVYLSDTMEVEEF